MKQTTYLILSLAFGFNSALASPIISDVPGKVNFVESKQASTTTLELDRAESVGFYPQYGALSAVRESSPNQGWNQTAFSFKNEEGDVLARAYQTILFGSSVFLEDANGDTLGRVELAPPTKSSKYKNNQFVIYDQNGDIVARAIRSTRLGDQVIYQFLESTTSGRSGKEFALLKGMRNKDGSRKWVLSYPSSNIPLNVFVFLALSAMETQHTYYIEYAALTGKITAVVVAIGFVYFGHLQLRKYLNQRATAQEVAANELKQQEAEENARELETMENFKKEGKWKEYYTIYLRRELDEKLEKDSYVKIFADLYREVENERNEYNRSDRYEFFKYADLLNARKNPERNIFRYTQQELTGEEPQKPAGYDEYYQLKARIDARDEFLPNYIERKTLEYKNKSFLGGFLPDDAVKRIFGRRY